MNEKCFTNCPRLIRIDEQIAQFPAEHSLLGMLLGSRESVIQLLDHYQEAVVVSSVCAGPVESGMRTKTTWKGLFRHTTEVVPKYVCNVQYSPDQPSDLTK